MLYKSPIILIFKLIKKPDDKSAILISIIVTIGVLIKFYEITMESILMENMQWSTM